MAPPVKRKIEEAFAANVRPTVLSTNVASSLVLALRGHARGQKLMINGVLTKAGEIYEQVYGEQLQPDKGFRGDPYTNNRGEWIQMHDGSWKKLGSMTNGVFTSTLMGHRYYKEHPTSYTVNIPIKIFGRNVKHEQYERDGHKPMVVSATVNESHPDFVANFKAQAEAEFGHEWSQSGEIWQISVDGPWTYSKMTVRDGHAIAAIDIPLRGDPSCHSWLGLSEQFGRRGLQGRPLRPNSAFKTHGHSPAGAHLGVRRDRAGAIL